MSLRALPATAYGLAIAGAIRCSQGARPLMVIRAGGTAPPITQRGPE